MKGGCKVNTLAVLLIVAAVALLSVEAFIPNFGVCGILGIASFIGSIIITVLYAPFGVFFVIGEFIIFGALLYLAYKRIFKKRFQNEVVLKDSLQFSSPDIDSNELLGKEGVAQTPLKPTGYVDFNGAVIEAISDGPYIKERSRVKVIGKISNRPAVRLLKDANSN
jgi:membrane-bound serine protease (ClpP class)